MYYGKLTAELNEVRYKYEEMFGYDPNGEEDIEYGEDEHDEYLNLLKTCVNKKQDMFEILGL